MKLLREIIRSNDSYTIIDESAFPFYQEKQLLSEDIEKHRKKSKKLQHLQHLEDMLIVGGKEGFDNAISALEKTHDYLLGRKRNGYSLQTKFDGSPTVIWGHDDSGKFFIGTKTFFNKTPKIDYNDADVDKNHGLSERLATKLKFLLKHLKNATPKEGIFQGDLMYISDEIQGNKSNLSFTPNTLTYNVDKNSYEGQKIMKSKVGIAAHTHYEKTPKGDLQAVFDIDMSQFEPSEDVHFLPTKLRGPFAYKSKDISKFVGSLRNAKQIIEKLHSSNSFETIKNHENLLLSYINTSVRKKINLSTEGYISFLYSQMKKRTEQVKLDRSKTNLKNRLDLEVKNIIDNKKSFENIFKAHQHLKDAKKVLVDVLSKNSPYKETILGEPSKPEGFVASVNGQPIKLVDREHFSAANFDWNAKANPEDNPLVMSFGRMNPPTIGHGKMIEKGADIARRTGAKQAVVASRSQDPKKNPLSPSQKLSWLKSMFPGKNVSVAGPNQSTLIAQLQHFHNQGVKDITVVVGADRVKGFQDILQKYNGPTKAFNFRRARVVSAGERDPEAKGVEGMSASKMRDAAKTGDYKTFKMGIPGHIKEPQSQEMFHTLRAEMGAVKIDQNTPGHSLAIYVKRRDKIGSDAKREIERRKRIGTWQGRTMSELNTPTGEMI